MVTWPAKDPDAVLDYVYRIPLDAGDSVAAIGDVSFTKLSGTVAINNSPGQLAAMPDTTVKGYGQDFTTFLSGGADGETSVFRIEWTTVGGRTNDDIITLAVVANETPALALTGYAKPLPAHLVLRYPAFAGVDPATIQYWLTDAERSIDTSWSEGDYAAALMSLAAHNMALAGLGTDSAGLAGIPAGVTRMKSGSFELGLTEAAANARSTGSLAATRYGQEYVLLLLRNRAGPRVTDTGAYPADAYASFSPYFGGP